MSEKIKELFIKKYLQQYSYTRISEFEWLIIPEELKTIYINHHYDNKLLLPDFILSEIKEPLKSKYVDVLIKSGYHPEELGLSCKDLSKDLLEIYMENSIACNSVSDELFDLFTQEQKIKHIKKSGNDYYITEYQFNHLKPLEKLDFIIFNGSQGQFMIDWYKTWKASVEREQQIDSVLK